MDPFEKGSLACFGDYDRFSVASFLIKNILTVKELFYFVYLQYNTRSF